MKMQRPTHIILFLTTILLVGCNSGGSPGVNPDNTLSPKNPILSNGKPSLAQITAYQSSEIGNAAVNCAKLTLQDKSCLMEDIKPLGANALSNVSITDIKSRIVASHSWMADSFIAALEEINDQDLQNLFKPLNSIVLSYDVRPSFYSAYSASIYIDPRYLWRDKSEWEMIFKQDDYRDKYQSEFITSFASRYINSVNSDYVTWSTTYSEQRNYTQRNAKQIAPGLFRLLAHELAHANDYLSVQNIPNLNSTGRIYHDNMKQFTFLHKTLYSALPLTAVELRDAAWVAYHGSPMTDSVRQLSGEKAGSLFEGDAAATFYAYSKSAEDVATLFETFMMYKKYRAISDVAFVSVPTTEQSSCDDLKIQWGQRTRLADKNVKQRAIYVANRILQRDVSNELIGLPSSVSHIQKGLGWCESRQTATIGGFAAVATMSSNTAAVVHDYHDDFSKE